jgi:hypothetical protein
MHIGDGSDGPSWNGSIQVCPGNLAASAPAFTAASNQVLESMASVFPWGDPGGTGITNPTAASAWARLVTVWSGDLNTLSNGLADLGGRLYSAGGSYQATDAGAMGCETVP